MIYLSFIGNHDNISPDSPLGGAAYTIFRENMDGISKVYLLSTGDIYKEIAEKNKRMMLADNKKLEISIIDVELVSPIDFDSIYQEMYSATRKVIKDYPKDEIIVNITSGTPPMTSCWVLLNKSGLLPNSTLVQSFESKFAKQRGKQTQIVNLEIDNFPQITSPDDIKSELNKVSSELKVVKEKQSVQEIIQEFPNLIGSSFVMQQLKKEIMQKAQTPFNTMILGATGTGKEIVARELFERSDRKDGPYKIINLGSKDSSIIESELFGHVKGAFTGAEKDRQGYFRSVDGGTLFIDEIGDLPLDIQIKLLRTLEYGDIMPVGSDDVYKVNVRVIGATNKDIGKLISEGQFREDLFMRFETRISLPILSERIDDISELINYFIRQVNSHVRFSSNCIEALKREEWPGNVRQLRSVIQLAGYLPKETPLEISDLTEIINQYKTISQQDHDLLPPLPFSEDMSIDDILDNVRNHYEVMALRRHNGNATKAATEDLHIQPHTLRKRLKSR